MDEHETTDEHALKEEAVFLGNHDSTLLDSLNRERNEEDSYCDITLCVDQHQFRGHRCVIGKLSKTLHKVFITEIKEKRETDVNLKGLNSATMQLVMDYIYTARVEITKENAIALLSASDYLQIDALKQHCSDFFLQNISMENVLDVQKAARMYNETSLAASSATFLSLNKETFFKHPKFMDLDKDEVESFLFEEERPEHEELAYKSIVRWVKHDLEQRRKNFPEQLRKVKLHLLPTRFLEEVVFKEPLICGSDLCQTFFASELLKRLKLPPVLRAPGDNKAVKFVAIKRHDVTTLDVKSMDITLLPRLPFGFSNGCVAACLNRLFLFGSSDGSYDHIMCLRLDEDGGNWRCVGRTIGLHACSKAVYFKGRVVISGGGYPNDAQSSRRCVKWFDPKQDLVEYLTTTSMTVARMRHSMIQYHDFLVCAGRDNSIEFTTIDAPKWFPGPSLIEEEVSIRAAVSCGDLYVFDSTGWLSRLQPFNGKWEKVLKVDSNVIQAIADDDTIYALIYPTSERSCGGDVWSYNTKTGEQRRRSVGEDFDADACNGGIVY